jgi:hypothetical protein
MSSNAIKALPVYVIGDSHALPYRNLIFRDKWTGQWVVVRSKYISGLTTSDFFDPKRGEFLPPIIDTLEYEGLVRNGCATHLSNDEVDLAIAKAMNQPVTPPLLFFSVGDIDIRAIILPMLGDQFDFVAPFELPYPVLDKPLIPWDVILETIERRMRPFIKGLAQLREAGFNRIYVQSVVPPTRHEERVRVLHGLNCPVSVRTKLVAAFNYLLRIEVESAGAAIVDIWPQVTERGYLKAEYELDGVHLPPVAAQMNVEKLLEHAINRPWESVNYPRHEAFYRMACNLAF